MYKCIINSTYSNLESFILNIREKFNENDNFIHKARNELKIINYHNEDIVVKSFQIPNILRRIYYTFIRDTKAKKSYDHSLRIGEFTPEPIAYIEFYSNNLLSDSYFIAKKFDYDFTIREPLLDKNFKNREEIFASFAEFTFNLHNNKIYHKDYSPGNILIRQDKNGYVFKIVDINRMEFKELSLNQRLNNFNKLWAADKDLVTIIDIYAKLLDEDKLYCVKRALDSSQRLKNRKNFKKRLKGEKVVD